jgi:hypothetical protein
MTADRFFSGTLNVLFGGRITCGGGLLILLKGVRGSGKPAGGPGPIRTLGWKRFELV